MILAVQWEPRNGVPQRPSVRTRVKLRNQKVRTRSWAQAVRDRVPITMRTLVTDGNSDIRY